MVGGASNFIFSVRKLLQFSCLLIVVFSASNASAQLLDSKERARLLPADRTIHGTVSDPRGNPISGANVDYTVVHDPSRLAGEWWGTQWERPYKTDTKGEFTFTTRAPVLVVRKPGYQSARIFVAQTKSPLHLTLQLATSNLRPCPSKIRCDSDPIRNWGGVFCFQHTDEVFAGRPGRDIDYGQRNFILQTSSGTKGMMYGAGPMWSSGMPDYEKAWTSTEYSETVYEIEGIVVIDARGKLPTGKLWREFGRFGESASYWDLDPREAHLFDQVLDNACVHRQK